MYSESSIAKPLSLAGGYAGDTAHKRQLETVRFWIDISEPGGLDKGPPASRGRGTAMRVRIMHVFIRRRLIKHPEWDLSAWGVPISISDATLTLMGGRCAGAGALERGTSNHRSPRSRRCSTSGATSGTFWASSRIGIRRASRSRSS